MTDRPGAGGFSALEQKFFEGAPPEVAVAPPPAPTFDDLDPARPERRKVRRTTPRRVVAAPAREQRTAAWTRLRTLAALTRAVVLAGLARVRPIVARAGALGAAQAREGWSRLLLAARRAKESTRPALRAAFSRFFDGLPGERPDGRTLLATVAVVVVVCGLSATVLGSRGSAWRPPAAASTPTH